jgi:uncharacterized protein YqgV (UPF0045/DUF77 family)
MNISIEISYYPLTNTYIEPIKDFIRRLNAYDGLKIQTNNMSTQVFGPYSAVMDAITNEIRTSFELPHSIFVLKIINADLR